MIGQIFFLNLYFVDDFKLNKINNFLDFLLLNFLKIIVLRNKISSYLINYDKYIYVCSNFQI